MINLIPPLILLLALFPPSMTGEAGQQGYLKQLVPGKSRMILIPAGEYYTGSRTPEGHSPLTKRKFTSFYIDIHPVTNLQYLEFLKQTGYKPEGKMDMVFASGHPNHPVTGVTRKDAESYAAFAGKRLPSEWEWEVAARALKKEYSEDLTAVYRDRTGVFFQMNRKQAAPVFSTPPNGIGFYDYIGNVFEWTTGDYPVDQLLGNHRDRLKIGIIRGGAWTNIRYDVTYSTRTPFAVARSLPWLGFRCAKNAGN